MNELFPLLSQFSAQATGALISAVWQGALLAALVGITLRLFPRLSPAARSVIWLNVFILLALLHLVPFANGSGPAPHLASRAVLLDTRWSLAVGAIWLTLSVFRAAQLVLSAAHLRALGGRAVLVEPSLDLEPLLSAPFNRQVRLCASHEVARPSVLGFFRPRILVPPAILESLSPAELRQVAIHEMEHLRRGDDWTNLLQKLALVVFPLNPALLWVERKLCAERELACDDRVLTSGSGRKAYALCLTHLAEYSLIQKGFSLVLGAWESRPELVRRVQRILTQPVRTMGRKPALAVSGALLSGAFACTFTLAHAPQLVGFIPPAVATQQAQLPTGSDSITDSGTPGSSSAGLGRWGGGAMVHIHALGSGPAGVVNTVMLTTAQPQSGAAYVRNIALKARPSKTAMPCPIKLAHKRLNLPRLQPAKLAGLRLPPAPAPVECRHTLEVLARWSDLQSAARAINPVHRVQQVQRINVVSAVYVLRTPTGWVIIEI
jgi:hypothetical protein